MYGGGLTRPEPGWRSIGRPLEWHAPVWYSGPQPGQLWCTDRQQIRTGRGPRRNGPDAEPSAPV